MRSKGHTLSWWFQSKFWVLHFSFTFCTLSRQLRNLLTVACNHLASVGLTTVRCCAHVLTHKNGLSVKGGPYQKGFLVSIIVLFPMPTGGEVENLQ